jgi:hypothetical protein
MDQIGLGRLWLFQGTVVLLLHSHCEPKWLQRSDLDMYINYTSSMFLKLFLNFPENMAMFEKWS